MPLHYFKAFSPPTCEPFQLLHLYVVHFTIQLFSSTLSSQISQFSCHQFPSFHHFLCRHYLSYHNFLCRHYPSYHHFLCPLPLSLPRATPYLRLFLKVITVHLISLCEICHLFFININDLAFLYLFFIVCRPSHYILSCDVVSHLNKIRLSRTPCPHSTFFISTH